VGGVLFQLVTGRAPFERDQVRALLGDVLFAAPPVPSALAEVPRVVRHELDALILRCLAKDPAQRPQSARELAVSVAELATRLELSALPKKHAARLAPAGGFAWAFGANAA
jgi:serine/threonine protein kinase